MDRRDALKKLGMGGAVVAGASMVVSSPAFASPGTPADVATAVSGEVLVVRTGSGQDTAATLQNVVVTCPEAGGSFDVGSVAWSNGDSGVISTAFATANGTADYTHSVSFTVTCSDRENLDVCATYAATFSFTVSGNVVNTAAALATTDGPSYVPC